MSRSQCATGPRIGNALKYLYCHQLSSLAVEINYLRQGSSYQSIDRKDASGKARILFVGEALARRTIANPDRYARKRIAGSCHHPCQTCEVKTSQCSLSGAHKKLRSPRQTEFK